jgi:two-component system, NtrC family, sensor kinase
MDFFLYLAAFLLIRRIQRSLKSSTLIYSKWRSLLFIALWGSLGLFFVVSYYFDDAADYLIGTALLVGIGFFVNKEPDLEPQRSYLNANIPLAVMGLVNGIALIIVPDFYQQHENYFILPTLAAFVWIFGRWATSKKQAEELRISAERRAELETLVQERTVELQKQKDELQETLHELRNTQAQLIQSEKMASLGELTAGIAHEIQNPLNFVNNFSEVTAELVDEMELELNRGDKEEAIAIASDIKQNLEKIMHHGKRADGIVKGMLQHSRASSNVKEPTDINKLADEYLRLAYHGLRAKDKSFNADLLTHFSEGLPMANMVPQDIGRVLLNLFNNAFYAIKEKQKTAGADFKPSVEVTTQVKGKTLEVIVKDNGMGIPDDIKQKILQPFFTTKPTGEGTGLGLSLSYDIVVKAHSGKIDVKSKQGEGSEFKISIPI